jgi:hypothetical protein
MHSAVIEVQPHVAASSEGCRPRRGPVPKREGV